TVLGWPSADVAAMSSRQIACWLVGLELLLEVPLEVPGEEQHPEYGELSARRAGQKLRALCCARIEAAVARLQGIPPPPAASPASDSCTGPDLIDDQREDALCALREAMGRLSLLRAAL